MFSITFAEEDQKFFEKRYKTKIEGVKAKSEYDDPDSFYSAIAAQLGIPQVAFSAVTKKYGWKKNKDKTMMQKAIVRRSDGQWIIMLFQMKVDLERKRPIMDSMEQKWAVVNDDKKVVYIGDKQPGKKSSNNAE